MNEFAEGNELYNKNESLIDNNSYKNYSLSEREILKCKENSFILIGKTGVGKTALLNVIFGEEIGKVGHTSESETKESNYYCIKKKREEDFIYFCIIDTPGLFDSNGFDADIKQKKDIMELISKEKLKIKGLLFLSNFQNERFDASEQKTIIEYNALFPAKEFWKRIILIFTHYFGDPDGDSKEDIKKRSDLQISEIFKKIMKKTKEVSYPINFKDINKKYINIYSKIKNDKQIKNNDNIREELISCISKYLNLEPMFNKLEIFNFEKYEIDINDLYLYDCNLILYLDSNNNIINRKFKIIRKYDKTNHNINDQKVTYNLQKCEFEENGNLINVNTKKEGLEKILPDFKSKIGGAITFCSIVGLIAFGIFLPYAFPICLITLAGGIIIIKKSRDEQKKIEEDQIKEIIEAEKIIEKIKKELEIIKESESLIGH